MKIYKPTYTDKDGKKKKCQHWYISFTDNQQKRHRLPAFSNKRATERAGDRIQELLSGVMSADLQQWIENIPPKMRKSLMKQGIINSRGINRHIGKPLPEHIKDFGQSLRTKNSIKYGNQIERAVDRAFRVCDFVSSPDIDANKLYSHLADERESNDTGERTFNATLKACKQFCKWMIKERRTDSNPLEHLGCITQTEKRRKRRALTIDEQRLLIEVTTRESTLYGLNGHDRVCYTVQPYRPALEPTNCET